MLKKIETKNTNTYAFEAIETVTAEDYNTVLNPLLEKARSEGKKVRFLFFLGPQFKKFSMGAAWQDFKLGLHHIGTFERVAIVSDQSWITGVSRVIGSLIPCPVRVFPNQEMQDALAWLDSEEMGLNFRLHEKKEVLEIKISSPLSSEVFEILSHKVDAWIENNGSLQGLVIEAASFPGWKDIGSLISHITFVKNHHKKIQKVALCLDGKLPELAAQAAQHFTEANVKHFSTQDLEEALEWASSKK